MKLKNLLLSLSLFLCLSLAAQQNFWNEIERENLVVNGPQLIHPTKYKTFEMDYELMKNYLFEAPIEDFAGNVKVSNTEILLPMPDGRMELFKVVESPIYEPGFELHFPGIKTFIAYSPANPLWYSRLDITPLGFHAIIFGTENGTVFIDPVSHLGLDVNSYLVYYRNDFQRDAEQFVCHHEHDEEMSVNDDEELNWGGAKMFGTCELRTYRLALACTGEYAIFHGGSAAAAAAAQVTTMNRVNGVFERELAIRMVIIANNNLLIYTNPATDPFTNGTPGSMINENQTNTTNVIGNANYDIGHVFGTNSGGLAGLGVVCNNSNKARGVTGSGSPIGDPFDIDYVAHEIGHQFRANHTQNNDCNRNGTTAMEPGSATTIMGYAGICSPNVQTNSDDYFHAISLQEMGNFITGVNGAHNCPVKTPLSNQPPTLSYANGSTISLPVSTPFALTAIATDSDEDDVLTYVWDQMDPQVATMPPVATSTGGPSFRSINPSTSPTRYFPNLPAVIAGTTPLWEVLPSVSRTMNFRAVVRDNVGCNEELALTVNFVASAGPFRVLIPSASGITWAGLSSQTVTWDVANTNASPVSCANVNILISYNGGVSFNDTIAANVPNTGSFIISVPNTATSSARIMVQCANGTFFNVSSNNFSITETTNDFTFSTQNIIETACQGANATYTLDIGQNGLFGNNVSLNVSGLPAGLNFAFSENNQMPEFTSVLTISNTESLAPGTYNFSATASGTSGTKTIPLTLEIIPVLSGTVNLLSPASGATDLTGPIDLDWNDIADALYELQISTSADMQNPEFIFGNLNQSNFSFANTLPSTTYYWQVTIFNNCNSIVSEIRSFTTSTCVTYTSTNVPLIISSSGTPTVTSTLAVSGSSGTITDVNVVNLQGTHTYIQDLRITLLSPEGTSVRLLNQICAGQDNFNIKFDDDAPNNNYPCPPTDGAFYIPNQALAAFNGESANGTWSLIINDLANQDGGQLNAWAIEICLSDPCTNQFTSESISGCDSVQLNDVWYFASQDVESVFTLGNGCDSTHTTQITVNQCSFEWNGNENTVWSNANNWSGGNVPGATNNVTIPTGLTNYPVIDANVEVGNLSIASGATLTVSPGQSISISGTYSNNGTVTSEPGYFINTETTGGVIVVSSTICPLGSFCADGISSQFCPAGTFQNQTGQISCIACAAGTFQSNVGAINCVACAPGTFASATGQVSCAACAAGSFQSNAGATSCNSCPAGSFSANEGQTSCTNCPAGTFADAPGQTSCTNCPAGTFQSNIGSINCVQCQSGTSQPLEGQVSCINCAPGTFASTTGQVECTQCQPGTYQPVSGATECINCLPGTSQSLSGQTECVNCPAGTSQPLEGQVSCVSCAPGTFASATGQASCSSCPAETYQPNAGSTECLVCIGQQDLGAVTCVENLCATTATIAEAELILLCNPQTRTLTVNFDGEVDAIQWYRRGQAISGATTASLSVNRWTIGDVYAVATCSGDAIQSNTIAVNKVTVLNESGADAHYSKVCVNQPTTFSAPFVAGASYQWRERPDGTLVSTDREYTFSGFTGSFDVFVISPSGCTRSARVRVLSENETNCEETEVAVRTASKTNLSSIDETVSLMFYPNPVTDKYVISLSGLSEDENFAVNWYDITGKQVKATEMIATGTGREATQNIGNLAKGIYVVKVENANHQFTFRVMVQ